MSNDGSHTENGQIPLILIHGAWLSARSWENYADYFGKRAFAVSAPEWPRKQGDVEEIRETAEASAGLGVQEIVDHHEQLIRDLDQPPGGSSLRAPLPKTRSERRYARREAGGDPAQSGKEGRRDSSRGPSRAANGQQTPPRRSAQLLGSARPRPREGLRTRRGFRH